MARQVFTWSAVALALIAGGMQHSVRPATLWTLLLTDAHVHYHTHEHDGHQHTHQHVHPDASDTDESHEEHHRCEPGACDSGVYYRSAKRPVPIAVSVPPIEPGLHEPLVIRSNSHIRLPLRVSGADPPDLIRTIVLLS